MSNVRTYLNFLNITLKKSLLVMGIIYLSMSIMMIAPFMFMSRSEISSDPHFYSGITGSIVVLSIVMGLMISTKEFNGAMRIRADRGSYFIASIASIIIFIFSMIFIYVVGDMVISKILSMTTGIDVKAIYSTPFPIFYTEGSGGVIFNSPMENISNLAYFGYMFLTCTTLAFMTYLCGCIGYRLRLRSNIAIFGGIPFVFVSLIIRAAVVGNMVFLKFIGNTFLFLIGTSISSTLAKLAIILICLLLSYMLIKRAPIKEYANDLL